MEFYLLLEGTTNTYQGMASSHRLAFSLKETVHPKSCREPRRTFSPKALPALLFINSYFSWSPAMSEDPTHDVSTRGQRNKLHARGLTKHKYAAWKNTHDNLNFG